MKNFVIRVYRQDDEDLNQIVGVFENVEDEVKASFSSMEELIRILCSQPRAGPPIDEGDIRKAITNRNTSDSGPDWGDIRFEPGSRPSKGEKGEREN